MDLYSSLIPSATSRLSEVLVVMYLLRPISVQEILLVLSIVKVKLHHHQLLLEVKDIGNQNVDYYNEDFN